MAYAINTMMVHLLNDKLPLTTEERAGAHELARWTTFFYAEQSFWAPFVADAALLDLRSIKLLDSYETYEKIY